MAKLMRCDVHYSYDAVGNRLSQEISLNGLLLNTTYTYDSANRLVEISDQSSVVSMDYNGLGQRLSMDAGDVIAHYVMDGDQPLMADSASNTTHYLYGIGAIGEKTTAWSYSLPDGTNTPRQLTDLSAEITLSARYTPWGDTLELNGTGNFAFGYPSIRLRHSGQASAASWMLRLDCFMLATDSIMIRPLVDS